MIDPLLVGNEDRILELQNFVDENECKDLIKLLEKCSTWTPDQNQSYSHKNYVLGFSDETSNTVAHRVRQIFLSASSLINKFYGDDFLIGNPGLRQWHPGESLGTHVDAANANGKYFFNTSGFRGSQDYVPWPAVDLSVLLYLNSDFSGGDLYFPYLNKTITPSQGLLVAFPSTRYFVHEVTEVKSGFRYTAFSFLSRVNLIACMLHPELSPNWRRFFLNSEMVDELIVELDND